MGGRDLRVEDARFDFAVAFGFFTANSCDGVPAKDPSDSNPLGVAPRGFATLPNILDA